MKYRAVIKVSGDLSHYPDDYVNGIARTLEGKTLNVILREDSVCIIDNPEYKHMVTNVLGSDTWLLQAKDFTVIMSKPLE